MATYAEMVAAGRCEIDLTTGWCAVHDTDCGPQREFEALDYLAGPDDPDAYPHGPDRPPIDASGRVPDDLRRPQVWGDSEDHR